MGLGNVQQAEQLQGTNGSALGLAFFRAACEKQNNSNLIRQHNDSGIYQLSRRSKQRANTNHKCDMASGIQVEHNYSSTIPRRCEQSACRSTLANYFCVRMDAKQAVISTLRENVWATHNRPLCIHQDYSASRVQQFVPRSNLFWGRRSSSNRLGKTQQLRQPSVSSVGPCSTTAKTTKGNSHAGSSVVAGAALVQGVNEYEHCPSISAPKPYSSFSSCRTSATRAIKQQEMENIRLESEWEARLLHLGWSHRAAKQFKFAWAESTLKLYNRLVNKLVNYTTLNHIQFPLTMNDSAMCAEFSPLHKYTYRYIE